MPKSRAKTPHPPARPAGLVRRVTHGALLVMGLKAAQLAAEESTVFRVFDPNLVDRLKAPLTRYHD
ncbi:MAG: hypothetical protein JSR48_12630 [Verrucomicrobia bacterium]|nr:hypothetical protein [Verrucomicrobiota bacterium]